MLGLVFLGRSPPATARRRMQTARRPMQTARRQTADRPSNSPSRFQAMIIVSWRASWASWSWQVTRRHTA